MLPLSGGVGFVFDLLNHVDISKEMSTQLSQEILRVISCMREIHRTVIVNCILARPIRDNENFLLPEASKIVYHDPIESRKGLSIVKSILHGNGMVEQKHRQGKTHDRTRLLPEKAYPPKKNYCEQR